MAAWWAAGYGVAQSRTRVPRLSSSSSSFISLRVMTGVRDEIKARSFELKEVRMAFGHDSKEKGRRQGLT